MPISLVWNTHHFRSALATCKQEDIDKAVAWFSLVLDCREGYPQYDDSWVSDRERDLIRAFWTLGIMQAGQAKANLVRARSLIRQSIDTSQVTNRSDCLKVLLNDLEIKERIRFDDFFW